VSLTIMTNSIMALTHSKSWRERVLDTRSCNAESVDTTECSASKWNRERERGDCYMTT